MKRMNSSTGFSRQQGIVLLEALVAVLLFSMGVLALVGLQAAMMKNTEDSKYRSEASYLAQQTLGKLWVDPTGLAAGTSSLIGAASAPGLPNGTRTVAVSGTEVTVTLAWQQPGQAAHQYTAIANIAGN
jgi:type IV pilus assembly protein PilV